MEYVRELGAYPGVQAVVVVLGSLAAAFIIERILRATLHVLAKRTVTELDDLLVDAVHRPIMITVVLLGLGWATMILQGSAHADALVLSALETIAVLVWSGAAFRIGAALLLVFGARGTGAAIIQQRTVPLFDMLLKITVISVAMYFAFLAWHVDLTAWLASAGIVGIAIGFAAKDTLANLFSGISIIADAPYKVGDMIVLDGGLRGVVTRIGVRSTRVMTRDDVEVTVPNAVIASSSIVNETGAVNSKMRIRVPVDVAYGCDIDRVRSILLECHHSVPLVATEPTPQVRFLEFGASGLRFELRAWIIDPVDRDDTLDALNCAIYKAFAAAQIEIPYSKHDLYIKELPAPPPSGAASSPIPS